MNMVLPPTPPPPRHAPQSPDAANLLTGCADGSAALWSIKGQQLAKLEGHTDRLGRVAWHPMGRHVVSNEQMTRLQTRCRLARTSGCDAAAAS